MPKKNCLPAVPAVFALASVLLAMAVPCPAGEVQYRPAVAAMPPLRGVMSPTRDLRESDLKTLNDWGINLVRFQISRNWAQIGTDRDLEEFDAWFNSRLDNFEAMLPIARSLGIRLVLDVHTPPGGWSAPNVMRMFDEPLYADHFVELWKRIAARFLNHPDKKAIWAYDLLNEPLLSDRAKATGILAEVQTRAGAAIREIDPDALLVATPQRGAAQDFAGFVPLPLDNVIYEAHVYDPFLYTHQFVLPETTPSDAAPLEYPGLIGGEFWSRSRLEKEMRPVLDFQKRFGARIYIGEFSAISWAPNADVWLADAIDIFNSYGWDWSYHSFREWEGFSLEHEGTRFGEFWPDKDNPRKKAFLNALKRK